MPEHNSRVPLIRVDHGSASRPPPSRRRRSTAVDSRSRNSEPTQDLGARRTVDMTVLAQDPALRIGRSPVTTTVPVPADRLEPGPRSHRFHIVDVDTATGDARAPAELADRNGWSYQDRFVRPTRRDINEPSDFHAQNVFAVASRTLATFEAHLGRRVPWAFGASQLFLVPHAFIDANAYYSKEDRAVLFGYLPATDVRSEPLYACLSHDIIAHELTHAILDGLRPRYIEPGPPDQLAFHEALADIVALLSVLSSHELVATVLRAQLGNAEAADIPRRDVTTTRLRRSVLLGLAEQLGRHYWGGSGDALRRSLESVDEGRGWRDDSAFTQPHRRGEVVVASVLTAFVDMWDHRLEPYRRATTIDLVRVAEEGARAAKHLLGMVVRASDYLPPVDLVFEDVVDAILSADETVTPDDPLDYRGLVERAFARYDIHRPPTEHLDAAQLPAASYNLTNRLMLETSRDEMFRFIWNNPEFVGVDLAHYLAVERVLATRRTGPDGLVVEEIVADYIQMVDADAAQLRRRGIDVPDEVADGVKIQILGGGVLRFDQYGRVHQKVNKPLWDTDRQSQRLAHLVGNGMTDSLGRYGFSVLTPRGQRFANLHRPVDPEAW